MKKSSFSGGVKLLLLPALLCLPFLSRATHIFAGEITFRSLSFLTYQAMATIYTDAGSEINTDTISLHWGDNTVEVVRGVGQTLPGGILKTTYLSNPHTYVGVRPFYVISVHHYNRIDNIININNGASQNFQLYIEDTLRIFDPVFAGNNNSPVLLSLPIDYANVNDTFYHNPVAFDPDGDSLSFQLIVPLSNSGGPVPNYRYPDAVGSDPFNRFILNPRTGEIIWATPKVQGIYNIAILVTEYRDGVPRGTVIRDMQIRVGASPNDPPRIAEFADTCVVAGSLLSKIVNARDSDASQVVTLSAEGGPLRVAKSPASFAPSGGNPASGTFTWQTACVHIRPQPYQVVFKAQDSYVIPLVDLKTWEIKVVAPAPENLAAQALGNQINLTWEDPYACDTITNFIGFSVWRREGSNPFVVKTCEPGLAGKGYTKVAQYLPDYNYSDNNVERGKQYCYRILAEFAERTQAGLYYNKVESLPSEEVCAELKRDVPLVKNVSVVATSATAGKIFVRWYRPKADALNLDTTQLSGPYSYKLLRATGISGAGTFTEVASFTKQFFGSLTDTTFTDSLLNTVNNAYRYKVAFYSNSTLLVGESDTASSVFLSVAPASNEVRLTWQERVPWQNFQYVIYRKNGTVFDSVATVSNAAFTDEGLINNTEYCYYIKSLGDYSSLVLNDTLRNLSQQVCATPVDNEPPCAVALQVLSPCSGESARDICSSEELPANELQWEPNFSGECDDDVAFYNIYYASANGDTLIKTGTSVSTVFFHASENTLAGCYAVTAVDSTGNESAFSNIVCVDNCPCYMLPNVFTPNSDGRNDRYTPIKPYRFVEKVDMKIYNRWGTLVYETTNPEIQWDGRDINNGKEVKEGVYYYVCEVHGSRTATGTNVLNGFIHVIRGGDGVSN